MRHIVGIDLGTTNTAMAHVDTAGAVRRVVVDEIAQLQAPFEVVSRAMLPSFLYLAGEHELAPGALSLPWHAPGASVNYAVGELARSQGAQVPGRLVASAKSWLCHPNVDRLAAILPWGEATVEASRRVSPVEASARYLAHLAGAWKAAHGGSLFEEEVVLCVPASFDEAARELTRQAASQVGLEPILLEEPQAAFYAWLADHVEDWRAHVAPGDVVLVCDIGGGTTDFSLISVKESADGAPLFERTAVGDHLLLGGDNLDLALARRVESRIAGGTGRLDAHAFSALVQACRIAKERLLSDEARASWTVTIAGRGSKLIGSALRDELTREEVETLVVDGFFPRVETSAAPDRTRAGLQEFGLPYASDPAVTKHLAAFLRTHGARPTAVLWNGGVLHSTRIRERLVEVLNHWIGAPIKELHNAAPDLAVAKGAAYFGLARRGEALRISGGAARAYYIGVDTAKVDPSHVEVMCVVPRGFEEGAVVELGGRELELLTNQPIKMRLFSSSERRGDRAGDVLSVAAGELAELPPIYTVLRFSRSSQTVALRVYVASTLTELGTLELECVARGTGNDSDRWKLHFDLRGKGEAIATQAQDVAPAPAPAPVIDTAHAVSLLRRLYAASPDPEVNPANIMKLLRETLGAPKEDWSPTTLRALWEPLKDLRGGRGKTAQHEARWMNLIGYLLRPGFGYALDDWRVKETWRLFNAGLVNDKDDPCQLEWWILWRRISGGLTRTQQEEIYKRVAPSLMPAGQRRPNVRAPSQQEGAEMWRTLASMERLTAKQKSELGDLVLTQLEKKRAPEHAVWALGRFGARVPLYGTADDVVPRARAEKWVERLLSMEMKNEMQAQALAEIARCSGDRARDLDEALRRRLAEKLKVRPEGVRLARLVLEPVRREAKEERLAFGDALPSGLRLVESS